jgi:hypothetical protein
VLLPGVERHRLGLLWRRHWPIGALLAIGGGLRLAAMVADRPVLMLFGDSYSYLYAAKQLRPNGFHPIGYSLLLRALWWTGSLVSVVALQHLLALALAVAVYAVMVHLGVRPWLAALGTLPLLLDAYQVYVEQTVVSETWFELLLTGGLLLVTLRRRPPFAICLLTGLLVAAATLTRGVAAFAAIPAVVVFLLLRRWGWRRSGAFLLAFAVPVLLYASWYKETQGKFAIQGYTGRLLYGRVETFAYRSCRHVTVPRDERVLCDPRWGADPTGLQAANSGVNFYAWDPRSPFRALRPPGKTTADELARRYAKSVIEAEPLRYLLSVAVDTAHYFAPTRSGVAPGQWPIQSWQFQPVTHPAQDHTLLGGSSFGAQASAPVLPAAQRAHWPVGLLRRYQSFGYTPGWVLAAAMALVLIAFLRRRPGEPARAQRAAAALLGLCGFLLLLVAAAAVGDSTRYLIPSLPLFPPAGSLALQSLLPARREGPAPAP